MDFNWFTIPLAFSSGAAIARITDIIKFTDSILDITKKNRESNDVYKIESTDLIYSNQRFGFLFVEPRTWDRNDPFNGDGNIYTHPTKSDVSYTVSGMYDVLFEGNINTVINNHLVYLKTKKGFKLLLDRPSGCYQIESPNSLPISKQQIEGWRLKYKYKDLSTKKNITVTELKCVHNGKCFSIHCQSNSKEFVKYEEFFLYLISNFRILREYSVPTDGESETNNYF